MTPERILSKYNEDLIFFEISDLPTLDTLYKAIMAKDRKAILEFGIKSKLLNGFKLILQILEEIPIR